MKKRTLILAFALGMTALAGAQTNNGGITADMLEFITAQPEKTQAQKALQNAVRNNGIELLTIGEAQRLPVPKTFSIETPKQSIHDQKSSGRCWMFSGMNVLRADFAAANEGKVVEFSQSHLFFWDQLEKSNLMLQGIIDTGKKAIGDPEVQFFFKYPVSDGGTFCGVMDLVDKYGLVPQSVAPETFSSESTTQIDKILREINIAHMLQALHLLHHPGINLRVAVAAVDNRHAGKAVQILPALVIIEVLHLPLDELPRLLVKMCQARHDIFLFLFQNGLRAYRLLQWHKTTLPYIYPQ